MSGDLTLREAITMLGHDAPTREGMLASAARRAGISFSQAKRIFYGETTDPKASVRQKIERALQKLNERAEAHARAKLNETADIAQLVARAVEVDAELRREIVALVFRKLTGARDEDRPMAAGGDR